MKKMYFIFTVFAFLSSQLALSVQATAMREQLTAEQNKSGVTTFTASEYKPGVVQHIVLFRYNKKASYAQIREVKKRFLALKHMARRNGKPYILNVEAGTQSSGEGADHGYQHGFIVTFRSQGDRNYYVGSPIVTDPKYYDPAHQKFKDFVGPLLQKENGVLVFDFISSGK